MKIIVDENISFGKEAFSQFGSVQLMQGRQINNSSLKDADALIVRSITRVDADLLKDTPVKFVGTATIGTDHIDLDYLNSSGITFSDAKGCNANAVAEYVFTSIMYNCVKHGITLKDKTIGVVGIGNIGSRIVRLSKAIGLKVIQNDPPLKRKTGSPDFKELNEIFSADIITLHVPLNKEGIDKTVHLFDEANLNKLKDGAVFINASRGQVVDNEALNRLLNKKNLIVTLDVWENEPVINTGLLEKVSLASPHIAGYSLEGKVNGTVIIYNALCNMLGIKPNWSPVMPVIESNTVSHLRSAGIEEDIHKIFSVIYDISKDDVATRKILSMPVEERGKYFDLLRKNYPLRREFINYKIKFEDNDSHLYEILKSFRFNFI